MDLYILRHAETKIDSSKPAHMWHLTEEGTRSSREFAESRVIDDIEVIFTSTEMKAMQTAKPFATLFDLQIRKVAGLNELFRGYDLSGSSDEYQRKVRSILDSPHREIIGWESPVLALSRFEKAIDHISSEYGGRILVVSHGLVITLYFAHLLGMTDGIFERWLKMRFLSWGRISQGIVVQDIVH